ncbi:MAG: hypothetical protein ACK41P_08810 [Asticcacaulis sp.]
MSRTGFLSALAVFSVLLMGLAVTHAQAQTRVLTWPGKVQSPVSAPSSQQPVVDYGPVPVPAPVQVPIMVPVAPTQATQSIRTVPLSSDVVQAQRPVSPAPVTTKAPMPVPALEQSTPVVPAKPVTQATVASAAPVQGPVSAPMPLPAATADAPYQIPATSKYANRKAPLPTPVQATGQNPLDVNAQVLAQHMPAPASSNGFVPGQQATNPETQRPRFYSLHRQYGLVPDPSPHPATPDPRSSVSKE